MKMRTKPRVIDVTEDDGMWLDKSTMTYYDKNDLEPLGEPQGVDEVAKILYPDPNCKRGTSVFANFEWEDVEKLREAFKTGAIWQREQI